MAPLTVSFSGGNSTDSDGTISSYAWTLAPGANASGMSSSYTYSTAGTYVVGLTALVVSTVGRAWMLAALGMLVVFAAVVHAWWLPKHGVDGWTAEPRERYYALLGLGPDGRPRRT